MSRFRCATAVFAFTFLSCFHAPGLSAQAADKIGSPSPADGIWLGTLHAGSVALRIQIHLTTDAAGHEICALDSLDQGAMGTPCTVQTDPDFRLAIAVPAVQGHWQGTLSSDGKTLTGTCRGSGRVDGPPARSRPRGGVAY